VIQKHNLTNLSINFSDPNTYRFGILSGSMSENVSSSERKSFSPSLDQILIECSYGSDFTACDSFFFEPIFDGYYGKPILIDSFFNSELT
jgi:hypothetical protein